MSIAKIKHTLGLLLGAAALLSAHTASAETEILDRVVAVVDDNVVLESELTERTESIIERLRDQYSQLPPREVLQQQILDQLILERIQLNLAEMYDIEISDQQINQAVQDVIRENRFPDEQALRQDLRSQGSSMSAFREELRREITLNQLKQGVVNGRIRVTEQEVENFLQSADGRFAASPDYRLGHILLNVPSDATAEQADEIESKARDIYEQLRDGADFAQMAMTHSSDSNALDGGDMGWRRLAQLPSLFGDAVQEMSVGEVSEPIRSGAGYHILKIHDQRGGGEQMVEQTRARHILIEPSEMVDDDMAREQLADLRRQVLEEEAEFDELVREHSDDLGTMLDGGDLGWVMDGMLDESFQRTMDNTEVGEISEPFRSQFGWHILEVLERREKDMSDQMRRNQAQQTLRSRRFDEELQLWQAEIRENAYVDVRI